MSGAQADWIQAFLTAQSKFPKITRDTTVTVRHKEGGGQHSYKYATLPDILETVNPVLRGEGLVFTQSVVGDGSAVGVETRIYHKAGHVEFFGPVQIRVSGDAKAAGSAITYARRYALCAALGIAPDEDDDGEQASKPVKQEPREQTAWEWLWGELKIFKAWDEIEKLEAAEKASNALAIGDPNVMDRGEADRMFTHIQGQYENRPQPEQKALEV